MATGVLLSEADAKILKGVIDRERKLLSNPRQIDIVPDLSNSLAPETYVALTPTQGIQGRSGASLGSSVCVIYRLVSGSLVETGVEKEVYNVSLDAIGGGSFVTVWRDKYGEWFTSAGTASGDASESQSGLINTTTQQFSGNKTFVNNVSVNGTLNVNGLFTFNRLNKSSAYYVLRTDEDSFVPLNCFWWKLIPEGDVTLHGVSSLTALTGDWYEITCIGEGTVTIPHASSLAGDPSFRLFTSTGDDVILSENQSGFLQRVDLYSGTGTGSDLGEDLIGWLFTPLNVAASGGGGSFTPSGARVYNSSNQTLAVSGSMTLAFDSERWDDASYHDNSTFNSRLTVPDTGRYLIGFNLHVSGATFSGNEKVWIRLNGNDLIAWDMVSNLAVDPALGVVTVWEATAGDYFEVYFQSNATPQTVYGDSTVGSVGHHYQSEFWLERVK